MISRGVGVEHGDDADLGAEMLGLGRDGEHGLRRRPEQQVVRHALLWKAVSATSAGWVKTTGK